jgi:hypothetical protein
MPLIEYVPKRFNKSSLAIIDKANEIIAEYQAQGFVLTLRQLYYQFVARDLIPNRQTEYKRLGSIINDGRLAGLIDWYAIEDRTRNVRKNPHFESPQEIIKAAADQYQLDLWEGQNVRPEVWIEKDALIGVIESVCIENDIPYFACRGYSSQSEQWRAGVRGEKYGAAGQKLVILHLGDHDPSGIDMTRDNLDRLTMFSEGNVEVKRLALNMDQVRKYNPPPNPAKMTDSRFNSYEDKYGNESWELDALDPQMIVGLVRKAIKSLRNDDIYQEVYARQEKERELLLSVSDNWDGVVETLGDN